MSEEEEFSEEEIILEQVKAFKSMADNLIGCQKAEMGEDGFFSCQGCEHLGGCMWNLSENLSALLEWMSQFVSGRLKERTGLSKVKDEIKELFEGSSECKKGAPGFYS